VIKIDKSICFEVEVFEIGFQGDCMPWKDIVCLFVIIIGVVLFLYGANYYDAVVGWSGVFLIIGGLFARIILMIYEMLKGKVAC